jgi:hypothetical protein
MMPGEAVTGVASGAEQLDPFAHSHSLSDIDGQGSCPRNRFRLSREISQRHAGGKTGSLVKGASAYSDSAGGGIPPVATNDSSRPMSQAGGGRGSRPKCGAVSGPPADDGAACRSASR